MNKYVELEPNKWVYLYAKLSPKNKKYLKRYFSTIYPRDYVRSLIAVLEGANVQFKQN